VRLLVLSESRRPSKPLQRNFKDGFPSESVIVLSAKGRDISYAPGTMTLPMKWSQKHLGDRTWRQRHRLRRAISEIFGFQSAKYFGWDEDIISEVAACDPDVIDLRELRRRGEWLARLLQEHFPGRQILTGSGVPAVRADGAAWRIYDPSALVSIVLPVYNGERYLRHAIESCLAQTHRALELIVVDDCSTDSSSRILKEYAECDSRVKVVRNARNRGLPESLNIGFREASGQYLTWTSDDNMYDQNALAYMAQQLSTYPDIAFVYTSYIRIDQAGNETGLVLCSAPTGLRRLELASGAVGACFMYRSEVRDEVGPYRSEYKNAEDFDYWIRICLRYPARHYYEPHYFYRVHTGSLTAQHSAKWNELNRRILHEHFASNRSEIVWPVQRHLTPSG
jgi:GT2 family glycosyltransferase